MAYAYVQTPGNGTNRHFSVPFPFIVRAHVRIYLGYDVAAGTGTELVDGTGFSWLSDTQIQTTVAPALGTTLTVIRKTPNGSQLVVWATGSPPTQDELNTADLQSLYVIQEQADLTASAVTTAATAAAAANAAVAAVAAALPYQPIAAVANIPASPQLGQRIEISNTTGLGSFTPLAGKPTGFVGGTDVRARLVYGTPIAAAWNWIDYFPVDPDGRYATITAANNAQTTANTAQSTANTAQSTANTAQSTANNAVTAAATAQARADRAPDLGTVKATTSGTNIDFTSIPGWVTRIVLMFNGVSTAGSVDLLVQLGVGTTPVTSGYVNGQSVLNYASGPTTVTSSTAGVPILNSLSTYVINGRLVIEKFDPTANVWLASGHFTSTAGAVGSIISSGSITLSGILGMLRLTTTSGAVSFDLGSVNIMFD
ncbi:hypothetical protein LBMAG41_13180 [Cyanobium sp.]|nr:hypothetical protein LBMAG41_13180 [Cyanobium sp.]